MKVANEAVQALGGAGYTKDWPVERYYRDAKLLDIGAGTNEIRRMLIGREVIGALMCYGPLGGPPMRRIGRCILLLFAAAMPAANSRAPFGSAEIAFDGASMTAALVRTGSA